MGFKLGQTVYIKTDPKQEECIVVSRTEFVGGTKTYTVGYNGARIDVYEAELSNEKDVVKVITSYQPE